MATTVWARMHGHPELPMSPGLLINQILAEFGNTSRKTARVGYTTDHLTTMDCCCEIQEPRREVPGGHRRGRHVHGPCERSATTAQGGRHYIKKDVDLDTLFVS